MKKIETLEQATEFYEKEVNKSHKTIENIIENDMNRYIKEYEMSTALIVSYNITLIRKILYSMFNSLSNGTLQDFINDVKEDLNNICNDFKKEEKEKCVN